MTTLELQNEHGVTIAKRRSASSLLRGEEPYARLLHEVLIEARRRGASDVHFEPGEHGLDIRLRVDGSLLLYKSVPREHRDSLVLAAKRVFQLKIGVSGKAQDERTSLPEMRLDLRVSLLPTFHGEKIVLRLLDLDSDFDLAALGFFAPERKMIEEAIALENGVVVVSGPTGSGKTRTLYALLKALGPTRFNIVTLEDPIEYRLEGLNQVQVSAKFSFADTLRSVLRQDPDVILVGEVRDAETAKLCFQAAETGHLVLTTLHANGAAQVVERLAGLGVDGTALLNTLRFSIAQRLEPRLCAGCARPVSDQEREWFFARDRRKKPSLDGLKARGGGCSLCEAGIRGRVPLVEWATPEGTKIQVRQTLFEAKLFRALKGEIDCREVMR